MYVHMYLTPLKSVESLLYFKTWKTVNRASDVNDFTRLYIIDSIVKVKQVFGEFSLGHLISI